MRKADFNSGISTWGLQTYVLSLSLPLSSCILSGTEEDEEVSSVWAENYSKSDHCNDQSPEYLLFALSHIWPRAVTCI